jgi:hypothetical protein
MKISNLSITSHGKVTCTSPSGQPYSTNAISRRNGDTDGMAIPSG